MSAIQDPNRIARLMGTLQLNVRMGEIPDEVVEWVLQHPVEAGEQFTRFLQNNARMQVVVKDFPIWKTINLGTGPKTADDFRRDLKAADCQIGDWGNDILGKPAFQVSPEPKTVNLVNVSGRELGFDRNATTREIWDRAQELGLELCPNEVGPQLRLQYLDQPMGERLRVAMKPIADSSGNLLVFRVDRDEDGLWLGGYRGFPDFVWCPDRRWVFVSRK